MIAPGAISRAADPIYFFDAYDGDRLFADSEGTRCHSLEVVREEATRILLEIAHDNISGTELSRTLMVVARDAHQAISAEIRLTFSQAK